MSGRAVVVRYVVAGMVAVLMAWVAPGVLAQELQAFEHEGSVKSILFSPDGRWVASSAAEGPGKVWSPATGAQRCIFAGAGGRGLAYAAGGTRIISCGTSGAFLNDPVSGAMLNWMTSFFTTQITVSPDSRQVACCSTYESRVQIRDASSGGLIHEMRDGPFRMAAFSPDGRYLMTGGRASNGTCTASVWDVSSYSLIREFGSSATTATCVGFTPDAGLAMMADYSGAVRFYDIATGNLAVELQGSTLRVYFFSFSPDGTRLATWGYAPGPDAPVTGTLWDMATGASIQEFTSQVAFSPDGARLVTGGTGQAELRDAATLEVVKTFPLDGGPTAMAFSPDGARLALGDGANVVHVYYVGDGQVPIYCADMFNDATHGEGPLMMNAMANMSPGVQTLFDALGWDTWSKVDMELLGQFIESQTGVVGDGLPDEYQLALVQYVLEHPGLANHALVAQQFEENRALFRADMDALAEVASGDWTGMKSYDELLSAMLGFSLEMRAAVNAFMLVASDGVSGLPSLSRYHVFGLTGAKDTDEPFSAEGDCDLDNESNIDEYNAVIAAGGDPAAFAAAATDPYNMWPGNPALPAAGSAGLLAMTAALAALAARRRH